MADQAPAVLAQAAEPSQPVVPQAAQAAQPMLAHAAHPLQAQPAQAATPEQSDGGAAAAAGAGQLEAAKLKFAELGVTPLFEKVLTSSDANGTGRIVIPKGHAEAYLPHLDSQSGTTLPLMDTFGALHSFKFRFWINNQSRMYLLENTQEVQAKYGLQVGDVLVFGRLGNGTLVVSGRPGTKENMTRKVLAKRPVDTPPVPAREPKKPAVQKARQPVESLKSKRIKQKQATQQVQSAYTYWSGYSLPPRRDGVFRAVPNSAAQEGDKVVAQYGCWTAIVNLGGEMYQAFFDNFDSANAAFEAARQDAAATGAAAS